VSGLANFAAFRWPCRICQFVVSDASPAFVARSRRLLMTFGKTTSHRSL